MKIHDGFEVCIINKHILWIHKHHYNLCTESYVNAQGGVFWASNYKWISRFSFNWIFCSTSFRARLFLWVNEKKIFGMGFVGFYNAFSITDVLAIVEFSLLDYIVNCFLLWYSLAKNCKRKDLSTEFSTKV